MNDEVSVTEPEGLIFWITLETTPEEIYAIPLTSVGAIKDFTPDQTDHYVKLLEQVHVLIGDAWRLYLHDTLTEVTLQAIIYFIGDYADLGPECIRKMTHGKYEFCSTAGWPDEITRLGIVRITLL